MLRHLSTGKRLTQKLIQFQRRKLTDNSKINVKTKTSTTTPSSSSGGGGGSGMLSVSIFLISAFIGAAYTVEQNEDYEETIQSYDIPFILDGMAPIREVVRSVGLGRPTREKEEIKSKSDDEKRTQVVETQHKEEGKDLHDDALEELAEDLIAEVNPQNDFVVTPKQVAEVVELLKRCREMVDREAQAAIVTAAATTPSDDVKDKETRPAHDEVDSDQKADIASKEDREEEKQKQEEVPQPILEKVEVEAKGNAQTKERAPEVPNSQARLLEARQNALEEVLEGMAKQTSALRDETERNLVTNLDGMDEAALRYRVAQLTTEFFERIKWEGVRQQQALQLAEEVLAKKYGDLLSQQENELKLDYEKKMFALEKKLRQESSNEIQQLQIAQETRVHEALTKQEHELRDQFQKNLEDEKASMMQLVTDEHTLEVAMLKEHHVKQMLETQKDIKAANENISALFRVVNSEFGKTTVSSTTHALSAAVLLAEQAFQKSSPANQEISALKKLSSAEPLVEAVVNSLPSSATTKGVPVLDDIKVRFIVVREEARKAALAPEGTNPIIAQMIGNFLSFISIKPTGNVQGDNVEAALARVDYYLERNDLDLALKETRNIHGYPRTLMSDWERMVQDRLVVDQAIRTLKTVSILRHVDLA